MLHSLLQIIMMIIIECDDDCTGTHLHVLEVYTLRSNSHGNNCQPIPTDLPWVDNIRDLPDMLQDDLTWPYNCSNYAEVAWLQKWTEHISSASNSPLVPTRACAITTPMVMSAWRHVLLSHPHRQLVHLYL